MQIRIQSTGAVVYEGEFRSLFPSTSLPQQLTEALINELGGDVVFEGAQASPTRYQTAYANGVEQVAGKWYTKYSVADMEQEAKDALDAQQSTSVRAERTKKLADTDWTQLTDAPVNSAAWGTYRQALRDVTTQETFPWEVTWPTQPE